LVKRLRQYEEEEISDKKKRKSEIEEENTKEEWNLFTLGYHFTEEGKLHQLGTESPFQFIEKYHYDLVAEAVLQHIQQEMKTKFEMEEVWLPIDANEEPRVNIFHTKEAFSTTGKLMVIICGTGQVRAGQWARSLCINESLASGSILPYLQRAKKEGYEVVVLNPNFNNVEVPRSKKSNATFYVKRESPDGKGYLEFEVVSIRGHETPLGHVKNIWKNYIEKSKASQIVLVAHSFGGFLCCQLLSDEEGTIFEGKEPKRVKAIALADSAHSLNERWSSCVREFLKNRTINWACSEKSQGTSLPERAGCPVLSSGTMNHSAVASFCMEPIFHFLGSHCT